LVLLSDESASREWINFEAGVGDGSGAKVVPVAIKDYRFDKLDFPLKGFQGRYSGDIEGVLFDIDKATTRRAGSVDKAAYVDDLRKAEESVTYKSLLFRPFRTAVDGMPNLVFEVENAGNVDIDLIFAEFRLPKRICTGSPPSRPPWLDVKMDPDSYVVRYRPSDSPTPTGLSALEPTITRSMGIRRLALHFPLKPDLDESEFAAAVIRYQIHGRNIETQPEKSTLGDIPFKI
jgi:hypothetical protein